jgi:hypothetical protein
VSQAVANGNATAVANAIAEAASGGEDLLHGMFRSERSGHHTCALSDHLRVMLIVQLTIQDTSMLFCCMRSFD